MTITTSAVEAVTMAITYFCTAAMCASSLVGWRSEMVGRALEKIRPSGNNGGPGRPGAPPVGAEVFATRLYRLTGILLILASILAGLSSLHLVMTLWRLYRGAPA